MELSSEGEGGSHSFWLPCIPPLVHLLATNMMPTPPSLTSPTPHGHCFYDDVCCIHPLPFPLDPCQRASHSTNALLIR